MSKLIIFKKKQLQDLSDDTMSDFVRISHCDRCPSEHVIPVELAGQANILGILRNKKKNKVLRICFF